MYRSETVETVMPRSCHEILGVSRGASAEDLALAFLRIAITCHPSTVVNEADRTVTRRRLREAAAAWAVLSGRPILSGDAADVEALRAFDDALAAHALGLALSGHDAVGILKALVVEGCQPVVAWPVAEQAIAQAARRPRPRRVPPTEVAPVRAATAVPRAVPRAWSQRLSDAARALRGLPAEVDDPYVTEPADEVEFDDDRPPPDANIAQRVAASLIDLLLIAVVCAAPVLAVGRGLEASPVVVQRIALAAMLLGGALYCVCSELGWGGTPGKRLLGLRVETLDGRVPDLQTVMLRHGLRTMSWCLFGIGFLIAPFTERRQAMHDLLTETRVMCVTEVSRDTVRVLCALPVAAAVLAFVLTRVGG